MHDSLISQPVAQGTASLETGTELSTTPVYTFSPTQSVATNAKGEFSLCAQAVPYPSVLVLEATDSSGKSYPPYVQAVTTTTDLGTIAMGGCAVACGLAGEVQTAAPATITGVVTSTPAAVTGTVMPQFSMRALDNSKAADGTENLWALALPLPPTSASLTFSTASGTCGGTAPFCASYTMSVPAQSPVYPVSGGTMQQVVTPIYMIYVMPNNTAACSPPYGISTSILLATPGAQLTAQAVALTNCR
ncbi:MAG: hypothetical protein P4L40_08650 [Terracidiphilus sp.]|nr:hypothetical protein [Terracidiphilus sp.]